MNIMNRTGTWIRTCQECGYKQDDRQPSLDKELSSAYRNRSCRKCESPGLDYGSLVSSSKKSDTDMNSDNYWDTPLQSDTVGDISYRTYVRRVREIMVAQLEEGDLFELADERDTMNFRVGVVIELQGVTSEPDATVIHYLYVTGDDKGKTESLTTDFDAPIWLVDLSHVPVF